ncbi:MAG: zinc-binding alcohol dehydrogenase family protein, partial [Pseudomonadota bacterium]
MKAVGYTKLGALDDDSALVDFEAEKPSPKGHDLLVAVRAISVNPVDYKIRNRRPPEGEQPNILGWDAVGEVVAVGDAVTAYKPGDAVWYAGAIDRPGTNAEFHLVDERIVGRKPSSVPAAEAAALPLTSLTAHEMLFDRLRVTDPVPGAANAIVIIGGAGGVGSIAIQLLRALTDVTVIATASRPETQAWAKELGAHHVIDHREPLAPQVAALNLGAPAYVFSTTHTDSYIDQIAELIAPQGRFGLIDDPEHLPIAPLKPKSVSLHWEFMFTRSLFA